MKALLCGLSLFASMCVPDSVIAFPLSSMKGVEFAVAEHANLHSACLNPQSEARISQVESRLLGHTHATEHARARAERCYAATHSHPVPVAHTIASLFDGLLAGMGSFFQSWPFSAAHATSALPSEVGQWSAPQTLPIIGITAVLLPTGKVLFWSYDNVLKPTPGGVGYIWDPSDGTGHAVNPPADIWCGGQTLLANGDVLSVGGTLAYGSGNPPLSSEGLNQIYTFNPFNETWIRQPDMQHGRWYPTVTRLPDGRAVITSGLDETSTAINPQVEVFTPSPQRRGIGSVAVVGTFPTYGLYPHQFVLPDGKMLLAGPTAGDGGILDPSDFSWTLGPFPKQPRALYGSAVLLPEPGTGNTTPVPSAKVMLIGGGGGPLQAVTATTEMLDTRNVAAGYNYLASLPQPRRNVNTVILPDAKLLTIGGNDNTSQPDNPYFNPIYEAEMYSPFTDTWKPMASQTISRTYHSTALLLPSAQVLSAGDDGSDAGNNIEIFSPPYLFQGHRPRILSVASEITLGQTFTVFTRNTMVSKIVLVAPGATTHANDMNQRYVRLAFSPSQNGYAAIAPPNANVAPPGYYMLFLIANGIPSVASWVHLN